MSIKKNIAFILCGMTLIAQTCALSSPYTQNVNGFEFSASVGPNWIETGNTDLVISNFETDSNRLNSVANHAAWKIGVGYNYYEDWFSSEGYLDHFLFELNLYQVSGTLRGNVWQYQLPQFNNYNFRAPFTSTRLMFDVKPYLFTWKNISPYLILGIGSAWNKLSYYETVTASDVPADTALSLNSQINAKLAAELGVGLSIPLTCHLNLNAEYVYAFLNKASTANYPTNGISLVNAPNFSIDTQTLLLGLSWNF